MSWDFTPSDGMYRNGVSFAQSPLQAEGCAISIWFHGDDNSSNQTVFHASNSTTQLVAIGVGNFGSGAIAWVFRQRGASSSRADSINTWSTGSWNHIMGIFKSNATLEVVLNGDLVNKGTNSSVINFPDFLSGNINYSIGYNSRFSSNYFNGRLASASCFGYEPGDVTKLALAKGEHPLRIRVNRTHWDLSGLWSPEICTSGNLVGHTWTVSGPDAHASNPPVIPYVDG